MKTLVFGKIVICISKIISAYCDKPRQVALELGFSILFLQQIVVRDIKLVLLAIKEG